MKRLGQFAWFVTAFNLVTIVGGALVRATESGAGCGRSWPLCQGSVESGASDIHRLTELTHRSMSAFAAVLVAVLALMVFRRFSRGEQPRRAAFWAGFTIIVEALLGAWLVLAELVEDNASVMRTVAVPVHLINTFLLLAALTLTAWLLTTGRRIEWSGPHRLWLRLGALGMLLLGATGGITALADTLFPAESVREGLIADFEATAHFLTRLRVIHPVVAIIIGLFLLWRAVTMRGLAPTPALFVAIIVLAQMFMGLANVLLLTPITIQMAHLVLADLLWMGWVVFGATLLSHSVAPEPNLT